MATLDVLPTDDREWNVLNPSGEILGTIKKLETGYLSERATTRAAIKRFRMIDSLREAFGEEHEFQIQKWEP